MYSNPPGTVLTLNSFSLATVRDVWPSRVLTKCMKSRTSNFTFLASLVLAKARGTTAWAFSGGSKQVARVAPLNVCDTLYELHQDLTFLASNPEVRRLLETAEDRKVLKARRRTDALAVQAWESAREGPDDSAGHAGVTSLGPVGLVGGNLHDLLGDESSRIEATMPPCGPVRQMNAISPSIISCR